MNKQWLVGRSLMMVVLLVSLFGGFASTVDPMDPMEGFDRAMSLHNDNFDKFFINTSAHDDKVAMPGLEQHGVADLFANIGDMLIASNIVPFQEIRQ